MMLQLERFVRLRAWVRGGLALGLSCAIGTTARAAEPPPPAPAAPAAVAPVASPVYTLADCLHIARQCQPSIRAAQASLAVAQDSYRGLNDIGLGSRLSKELPIRKQQALNGIAAAQANLGQVQHDVDASVARLYFAVIYARMQRGVADQIVLRLKATVANGETLLGKEGAPPDLNRLSIEKGKVFLAMAQTRVSEADRGMKRATAALKEAMGIDQETEFTVPDDKLPAPGVHPTKDLIVQLAKSCRGEVGMANSGVNATRWEIQAQQVSRKPQRGTGARGADVHAKPIPTGSFGDDYKPGAIGLDFPTLFAGPREDRVQRAIDVAARAEAAADKTRDLVALEAADAYLKWEESIDKIAKLTPAVTDAEKAADQAARAVDSGVIPSYRDALEILVMAAQLRAHLNEALYNQAVALTELERVTAGGFPTITTNIP